MHTFTQCREMELSSLALSLAFTIISNFGYFSGVHILALVLAPPCL